MRRRKSRCGCRRTAAPTPPRAPTPTLWWPRRKPISVRSISSSASRTGRPGSRTGSTPPTSVDVSVRYLRYWSAALRRRRGILILPVSIRFRSEPKNHISSAIYSREGQNLTLPALLQLTQDFGELRNEEDSMRGRVRARGDRLVVEYPGHLRQRPRDRRVGAIADGGLDRCRAHQERAQADIGAGALLAAGRSGPA